MSATATPASRQLEQFDMIIDGRPVGAASGRTYESENPYLGQSWAVVPDGGVEDVDRAVVAARGARGSVGHDDRVPARRADAPPGGPDHRER